MIVSSFDRTSKDLPDKPADHYSTNNNGVLDEISLFVAGKLFDHVGSFAQVTYSGIDRKIAWDNVDVRYAKPFQVGNSGVVAGISVNNSPTTQDLWNSTPVWGFPYAQSELAPSPAAAPLINSGLAATVLGTTAYAMINDTVYVELGGYRGLSRRWLDNLGVDPADSQHVKGVAPYWRAAVQKQNGSNYLSGGIFGLSAKMTPGGIGNKTDHFTDYGFDTVYQYDDGVKNAFTANIAFVREQRKLDGSFAQSASDATSNHLNSIRTEFGYGFQKTWIGTLGLFSTTGSRNAALFGADPTDGSANGKPTSRGYTLLAEYIPFGKSDSPFKPFANARFGLQYTGYLRFNGGQSNYDGAGRNASDNNTTFFYTWLAF
jgi:hypothetical protein